MTRHLVTSNVAGACAVMIVTTLKWGVTIPWTGLESRAFAFVGTYVLIRICVHVHVVQYHEIATTRVLRSLENPIVIGKGHLHVQQVRIVMKRGRLLPGAEVSQL